MNRTKWVVMKIAVSRVQRKEEFAMIWSSSQHTITHGPNLADHLFSKIQFYWNTATFTHLHTFYGCVTVRWAEVNNCNRDLVRHTKPKVFTIWFFPDVCWLLICSYCRRFYGAEEELGPGHWEDWESAERREF